MNKILLAASFGANLVQAAIPETINSIPLAKAFMGLQIVRNPAATALVAAVLNKILYSQVTGEDGVVHRELNHERIKVLPILGAVGAAILLVDPTASIAQSVISSAVAVAEVASEHLIVPLHHAVKALGALILVEQLGLRIKTPSARIGVMGLAVYLQEAGNPIAALMSAIDTLYNYNSKTQYAAALAVGGLLSLYDGNSLTINGLFGVLCIVLLKGLPTSLLISRTRVVANRALPHTAATAINGLADTWQDVMNNYIFIKIGQALSHMTVATTTLAIKSITG